MWYVYLLRCADATLYCGVTTDMERRLRGHNAGSPGAPSRPARRPAALGGCGARPAGRPPSPLGGGGERRPRAAHAAGRPAAGGGGAEEE